MLTDVLKKILYLSGTLGAYHRVRNARTLTVIMFHRVLDPLDARWATCDPAYTVNADLFGDCLRFFVSHYNIVTAEQVLCAHRGSGRLPPRALLITFDDGWADNVEFALPRMRELGLPGLLFVVADAIDRAEPFYQERIVGAWRRGTLSIERLAHALGHHGGDVPEPRRAGELYLRDLIKAIEALDDATRSSLLAALEAELADGLRHMVSTTELRTLDEGGIVIGSHGRSHTPLTKAVDLDDELAGARAQIAARMPNQGPPTTMSFPHGRFDASIAAQARKLGYELLFTSIPKINSVRTSVGSLMARLGFEAEAVTDDRGQFRPERMALYLFRKPHKAAE